MLGEIEIKTDRGLDKEVMYTTYIIDGLKIRSTKDGIFFEGKSEYISCMPDLEKFAQAVSAAWKQHLLIKENEEKIQMRLSLHELKKIKE